MEPSSVVMSSSTHTHTSIPSLPFVVRKYLPHDNVLSEQPEPIDSTTYFACDLFPFFYTTTFTYCKGELSVAPDTLYLVGELSW